MFDFMDTWWCHTLDLPYSAPLCHFFNKYRVYFDNLHQELTCYRLALGLLRFLKGTGRKLLLGQKYSLISFKTSQEDVFQKEEFHGLVFWGWNSGWRKIHFFFMYWILNTIDFNTWLFLKSSIVRTLKAWI